MEGTPHRISASSNLATIFQNIAKSVGPRTNIAVTLPRTTPESGLDEINHNFALYAADYSIYSLYETQATYFGALVTQILVEIQSTCFGADDGILRWLRNQAPRWAYPKKVPSLLMRRTAT